MKRAIIFICVVGFIPSETEAGKAIESHEEWVSEVGPPSLEPRACSECSSGLTLNRKCANIVQDSEPEESLSIKSITDNNLRGSVLTLNRNYGNIVQDSNPEESMFIKAITDYNLRGSVLTLNRNYGNIVQDSNPEESMFIKAITDYNLRGSGLSLNRNDSNIVQESKPAESMSIKAIIDYDLRGLPQKEYGDCATEVSAADLSSCCSEYVPSPDRIAVNSPSSTFSGQSGDSQFINNILKASKSIDTPSTVSNLSLILTNSDFIASPTIVYKVNNELSSTIDLDQYNKENQFDETKFINNNLSLVPSYPLDSLSSGEFEETLQPESSLEVDRTDFNMSLDITLTDSFQNEHSNVTHDIKKLVNPINWRRDKDGNTIRWSDVMEIYVSSSEQDKVFFKYDYDEAYSELNILNAFQMKRRGQKPKIDPLIEEIVLERAYHRPLPISKALHTDLLSLCNSKAIPRYYHSFYESLISEENSDDCNIEQEDDDANDNTD